jgi:phosphatidylserine/phosphatidylglycerophosphate/cardiolipin synthase-like enzyme
VSFTRGFISSQAFVDKFQRFGAVSTLLPDSADDGLAFVPTHPKAATALEWMGFEARRSILEVLDAAAADPTASVRVIAYDLNDPEIVSRLEQLGSRLRVIVDDSGTHQPSGSAESQATARLIASAGAANVRRQHMGNLQHNKTIVVTSATTQKVVCGSTNFSWRGFYVQNNNAVVLTGSEAVAPFAAAFEQYWPGGPTAFGRSPSAAWTDLGLSGIRAKVAFSPHSRDNALLASVGADIETGTTSSVLYSLAFLYQTSGPVREAVTAVTANPSVFVAGISDRAVGGIAVQTPDGNVAPVYPATLSGVVPIPFSEEPTGGSGIRMHHKFVVIDFNKPTARVYLGSYNFSGPADNDNGENLMLVADRRIATAYAVEAVRLFDHYEFRVRQQDAATAKTELSLRKPPRQPGDVAWFDEDFTDANKILDRKLFA